MQTARLWFARIVTLYAVAIFSFLSFLYVVEPLDHIVMFGIAANGSPESVNFLRAGPGALFTGLAITAVYGLCRPSKLLACLWVIVVFNGCVVGARLLGIALEGANEMQLSELRDEGISWLAFVIALVVHPRAQSVH